MVKGISDFPTGFGVAGFACTWDAGASQQFPNFSQVELVQLLWNLCVHGGKEGPKLSVSLSC